MRRRLAVVALATILLVAGCVGGPSQKTATPTATETPAATETPEYPTGFGPDGVTNASAAASAHADALLASDGFTFAFNATRSNGGEHRGVYLSRVDLVDRQLRTYVERPDARYVQFYGNGTVYEKITRNNRTSYRSYNATSPFNGTTGRSSIQQLLAGAEYGEATRVDGGFQYRAQRLTDAKSIVGVKKENVSSFSATVVVAENGIVRAIEYTATYTRQGTEFTVDARLSTTKVGETSVERPDWTSKA